jgi:hypothetical protein
MDSPPTSPPRALVTLPPSPPGSLVRRERVITAPAIREAIKRQANKRRWNIHVQGASVTPDRKGGWTRRRNVSAATLRAAKAGLKAPGACSKKRALDDDGADNEKKHSAIEAPAAPERPKKKRKKRRQD